MQPLKICIFTETYYPVMGGGETQANLLSEGLIADGHSVIILTRRSDKALKKVERVGSVVVYRLAPVGKGQLKKWGLLLSGFPALFRLRSHYDLIFVSGFRIIGIPALLLARLLGKSCVFKSDSLDEMSGKYFSAGLAKFGLKPGFFLFRLTLWLRNTLFKKADAFVAISSVIEDELLAEGVPAPSIIRIPNSVDTDKYFPVDGLEKKALRSKLSISNDATVVIYTGRLVSYKGLPLVLEVWKDLQKQHPQLLLLLVGSGGDDIHNCEGQLKEYVHQNSLDSSVRFTGSVQNVDEYLKASDVFVFPTTNEAFGISVIEAMACGLPVVATNVGGLKDILVHGLIPGPDDWVDYGPILEKGDEGEWDFSFAGITPASLIKKDGTYYLYYVGADGYRSFDGGPRYRSIGVATSEDGIKYQKYEGNPIMTHSPLSHEEEGANSAGITLDQQGNFIMYYGAAIGETDTTINANGRLAVSQDGFNFIDKGIVVNRLNPFLYGFGDEIFPVAAFQHQGRWNVYYQPNGCFERKDIRNGWGSRMDRLPRSSACLE
jgi:glycosyltransferase involved in cell wall biosynthesis